MLADGYLVGDGSWDLRICVTDLQVERSLRVKGDLHIGGVMLRLVEDLDIAMDWSDHALWWPARNAWLSRTRSTLDQYGVQADALLLFTPMHKTLRVQLPDLRFLNCRIDFSVKAFDAVVQLCKELGIRHPEELSLCKPLEQGHLRHNLKKLTMPLGGKRRGGGGGGGASLAADTNTFIAASGSPQGSTGSLDGSGGGGGTLGCTSVTPARSHHTPISSPVTPMSGGGTWRYGGGLDVSLETSNGSAGVTTAVLDLSNGVPWGAGPDISLAASPPHPAPDARAALLRPRTLVERARLNVAWLDSSLSIMEQGVREFDTLRLRFKFFSFYDLNPKMDAVRINQLYEQAKWQLLSEEIDCTEEEMLMFAALQVQVTLQAGTPQGGVDSSIASDASLSLSPSPSLSLSLPSPSAEDDIDAALTDLQVTLEGSSINSGHGDITHVPELCDYLRFSKPKKLTLKAAKRFWFTCRDLRLALFKSSEEATAGSVPAHVVNLRGCEVTPDVNIAHAKFAIKLEVPSAEGMAEMSIRCDTAEQYARWLAACRLAAKGRSLADASYEAEVKGIEAFLQMQRPAPAPAIAPGALDINPDDFVASRFAKRHKTKLVQRILEAHANVKDLPLMEAKLNYIKAWQSLPEYGISLFVVKFMGHKKEELLGVAPNRLMRMDINSGDHIKTWRYNTMKAWNVNWEVRHMMVQFEDGSIIFNCLSADCKVIHEFIGGYIFLSMRSKEANQTLNDELFHKLTGGWV